MIRKGIEKSDYQKNQNQVSFVSVAHFCVCFSSLIIIEKYWTLSKSMHIFCRELFSLYGKESKEVVQEEELEENRLWKIF